MLRRILQLKKHRESRLRQQMMAGNARHDELIQQEEKLRDRLSVLRNEWRILIETGTGMATPEEREEIHGKLKSYYDENKKVISDISNTVNEYKKWESEKISLQNDINKCCIQQEKLIFVIRDGTNDH